MTKGAAQWYDCISSYNCTGLELAAMQWGRTGVTKASGIFTTALPIGIDENPYTPSSDTVAAWGSYPVSGV